MKRLRISALARADLADIRAFGAEQWGAEQAEKYGRMLLNRLKFLRRWPNAGVALDETIDGLRHLPVGSHAVYYLEQGDYLIISRILHRRMDYRRRVSSLD